MDSEQMKGIIIVVIAGFIMGSSGWPIKLMKKFQYEHFAFLAMLFGLIIAPWAITLAAVGPSKAIAAYQSVDLNVILKSNLFSMIWGVANVLCTLCFVRIGFSLTNGILTGIGVSVGVITPMIFKGSGLFEKAPDLFSKPGYMVLTGVCVMIFGVVLASLAGFGRDKVLGKTTTTSGNFAVGFVMVVIAGITSAGISFSFVYSQGPITEAMKAQGAGTIAQNFAVWAVGLCGGALINVLYPAYLMTKKKSWKVLTESSLDVSYCLIMGINSIVAMILMGLGMKRLGVLGASVGFGVQQAMQMLGGQAVGFIGKEWKGVKGKPIRLMYLAIIILIIAAVIMSYGNKLAGDIN